MPQPATGKAVDVQRRMPLRTVVLYLLFGLVWIFVTDRLLILITNGDDTVHRLQTFKGWFFVAVSGALLYWLLFRHRRRELRLLNALRTSEEHVRQLNADLEQRVVERTQQLEEANRELEAFSYAVSHDLRAPLRSIAGFTRLLRESGSLNESDGPSLQRIEESTRRMSALIDDLLGLSRVSRCELNPTDVDLSHLASEVAGHLRERDPARDVDLIIQPNMRIRGDANLLRIAVENLLDNAWKYTAGRQHANIVVGCEVSEDRSAFFVKDNGVGFDMKQATQLFAPFKRLHSDAQFPGTGIGLVTVQRIIHRHGGRIWVKAAPEEGATFYFMLAGDSHL